MKKLLVAVFAFLLAVGLSVPTYAAPKTKEEKQQEKAEKKQAKAAKKAQKKQAKAAKKRQKV